MATTKKYNIEIDVDSKTLGQLEDQLADVNQELKDVDRNSQAFKNLTKEAQLLNAEIEKTNNEIDGLKLEDKLMAADGAAKVFGGSLSSVVGTLGVLGIESEAFGKFEEKAASAIAVGLGVKDVAEGFGNLSIVMKKSGIAAKLFGNVTKTALIATGIGAFVVVLGTIIAYWDDITAAVKKFAQSNAFVQAAIDKIKGAFDSLFEAAKPILEFLGILPDEAERAQMAIAETASQAISQLEREIAIATAAGKSAKALYDLRKQLIDQELIDLRNSNAEKEEIFAKQTELMALNAAEQRRIREENEDNPEQLREKITSVNAIKVEGLQELQGAELEVLDAAAVNKSILTSQELQEREIAAARSIQVQQQLDAARQSSLDNVIAIAGAESKVGRAALIAKQVLAAQELVVSANKTLKNVALEASETGVAVAGGFAKTLAAGFPQNIPLLIGYAIQAAGIVMAIKSAVGAAKGVAGGGGPSVGMPSAPSIGASSGAPQAAQDFDVPQTFAQTQPAIKAYVLSGDARSAQEVDAKIERRRTID